MRAVAVFLAAAAVLHAETPATSEAAAALESGFPRVALVKIEQKFPAIGTPTAGVQANLLYARALVEDGQYGAAAAILEKPDLGLGSDGKMLLARAQALNGDWRQALAGYDACLADPSFQNRNEAAAGRARMLANLGDRQAALAELRGAVSWPPSPTRSAALMDLAELALLENNPAAASSALDAFTPGSDREKSRRNFLLARVAFSLGKFGDCVALLDGMAPSDQRMDSEAAVLRARALAESGRGGEAESQLEEFISSRPGTDSFDAAFEALDAIYAASPNAASTELARWAGDSANQRRKALATFYLAKFQTRRGQAAQAASLLETLAAEPASNPLAEETTRELASLRIRLGQPADALTLLPPAGFSPHTDFLRGLALAGLRQNESASAAFLSAAKDPQLAESALFNAALCGLLQGNPENPGIQRLIAEFPSSQLPAAYRLQEAFELARQGDLRAPAALHALAESNTPGVSDRARLATAEWKYRQLDTDGARLELQRVSTNTEPARQAALRVFLEDKGDPASSPAAIAAARQFLAEYEGSGLEPAVRMKLGELLYAAGDFASARVELESLAEKFPESEFEEPALFLAAQASSRIPTGPASTDTLLLYERVAAKNGPLALRARLRQAEIQAALGKPGEANTILDRLLASGPDRPTKAAALIEKGKNLQALAESDPANLRAAIEAWKQVAAEEASDPDWRNQALTRIGAALEKSGDPNGAVAAYYDVFNAPASAAPQEFFWFYKAGFAAAGILESQEKWDEAIRVYEILRGADGPRSLEAANRIKNLRLAHFLWEGE